MNKNVLGIAIVVGVLALIIGVGFLLFFASKKGVDTPVNAIFGTDTPAEVTPQETKEIPTVDGETVSVPDFTKDREPIAGFEGPYYDLVYGSGPIFGNEGYAFEIQYDEKNAEFLVVLVEEPLGESRKSAEDFLRNKLALTNADLCTLNVFVTVPFDVNEVYGQYTNLGLSFCPNSVPLP
jgi:hypothetical protein